MSNKTFDIVVQCMVTNSLRSNAARTWSDVKTSATTNLPRFRTWDSGPFRCVFVFKFVRVR